MRRLLTGAAAAVFALVVGGVGQLLLHPTELYLTPPRGCPGGYGWDDVAAYASLAVVLVLAGAAVVSLVRRLRSGDGS